MTALSRPRYGGRVRAVQTQRAHAAAPYQAVFPAPDVAPAALSLSFGRRDRALRRKMDTRARRERSGRPRGISGRALSGIEPLFFHTQAMGETYSKDQFTVELLLLNC